MTRLLSFTAAALLLATVASAQTPANPMTTSVAAGFRSD